MLPIRETKSPRGKVRQEGRPRVRDQVLRRHRRAATPISSRRCRFLGDAYTKTGQWEKGLQIDQRLARLCPDNALVFYNLACSYSVAETGGRSVRGARPGRQTGLRRRPLAHEGPRPRQSPPGQSLRKDPHRPLARNPTTDSRVSRAKPHRSFDNHRRHLDLRQF